MGRNRFEKSNISDPFGYAATFKEVKRIPMDKPVGKYKFCNTIKRPEGTSHQGPVRRCGGAEVHRAETGD